MDKDTIEKELKNWKVPKNTKNQINYQRNLKIILKKLLNLHIKTLINN